MPLIPEQLHLSFSAEEFSEDALYYLSTKFTSNFYSRRSQERVDSWLSDENLVQNSLTHFKIYPGLPLCRLRPDFSKLNRVDWEKVVLGRKSSRSFEGKPISFRQLSTLLMMSCGVKESGRWLSSPNAPPLRTFRALPSGGAMYPLEYYVLAPRVTGLPPALYHFNLYDGGLIRLAEMQPKADPWRYLINDNFFGKPAAIFYVTTVFERSRVKYGPRALRYILLEAGGVGTHTNLVANALGLGFCFNGGGYENVIEDLIGIDGRSEGIVTSWMVGHANEDQSTIFHRNQLEAMARQSRRPPFSGES